MGNLFKQWNIYYLAVKKNKSMEFTGKWIKLKKKTEQKTLNGITQTPKDKYDVYSLICAC